MAITADRLVTQAELNAHEQGAYAGTMPFFNGNMIVTIGNLKEYIYRMGCLGINNDLINPDDYGLTNPNLCVSGKYLLKSMVKNYTIKFSNDYEYHVGFNIKEDDKYIATYDLSSPAGWTIGSYESKTFNASQGHRYTIEKANATIWYGEGDYYYLSDGGYISVNNQELSKGDVIIETYAGQGPYNISIIAV